MSTRSTSPPPPATRAGRIPQLPALDGLRAVAVVAVLLWHAEVGAVRGGFLGVESFFVVSGYLITALLWTERKATGRTSLKGFWIRRARRLLPALYLLLLVVLAALVVGWRDMVARARGDAMAAAVYVSNWYQVLSNQSYFAETGRPSPFKHLWSLAVEEQFYLLWPLLLLGLIVLWGGDRVRIAVTVAALAAASGLAMAVTFAMRHQPGAPVPYDPSRLYYGLDTRAGGLLLGCALALVWRPWERPERAGAIVWRRRQLPSWSGDALGLAGLAVLLLCFWQLSDHLPLVYVGGLQLVAVATALVIVGTTGRSSPLARLLGARPLVVVGQRSYSLYLWHWPVYVVTRPGLDVPLSSGPTLVLRLALSFALAELSYRFVEVPVRQGVLGRAVRRVRANMKLGSPERRRQVRRSWSVVGAGALSLLLVLGIAVVRAQPPPPLESLLAAGGPPADPGEEPGDAPDPLVPVPAGDEGAAPTSATSSTSETSSSSRSSTSSTSSTSPRTGAATAGGSSSGTSEATSTSEVTVYAIGDSVMLGARGELTDAMPGLIVDAKLGRYMAQGAALVSSVTARYPALETIVVHLGSNGGAGSSEVVDIIEAAEGRQVVFVTVKVPRRWEATSNSAITRGTAGQPNVQVVDWKRLSASCPGGSIFYEDGIHLKPAGAICYAELISSAVG